ncbi:hypothetical protein [Streptomyces viridosporus]|uniref:Lipoprotein n=1 Tax=Streptomyces viridosporus T7A TaxID=665577 RepID=A0ABX6ADU7_STRVD|nr:hypothetical protein [Streptomyces viridosporus]QEU85204.1 hypothetical protein CP969_11115 [Streptomyces viridosporus T7A]
MRRGGGRPPAAGAFGTCLVAALVTGVLATGCGAAGSGRAEGAPPAGTGGGAPSSPSPRVTSDEDLCAKLVGHWSRRVLEGRTYGDYQSMGLSGGQYDILREVVDAARAAERRGTAEIGQLIDRQAREGCAARYRTGGPGGGPWR